MVGQRVALSFKAPGIHRKRALKLPPRPPKPPPYAPKGFGWVHPGYGGYNGIKEQPVVWVAEPKEEPEKPRVAPKKRRKGKHYLSEIAEKMPGKLAVLSNGLEKEP